MTPAAGLVVAVALLLGLLLGARALQVRAGLPPETARKVMHIGMGVIALGFPWLLREVWAVLTLCALTAAVLWGLRRVSGLRRGVGGVLHSVERRSSGDLYFLLAVGGLYVLARGDAVLYAVPLAVLTFADGLAALTGVTYGRTRYQGADGFKTVEGSVAFAAVTFVVTHVPLLLLTEIGRAESVAVAALVAALTMLVEAVSWEGVDNVLVPLAAFVAIDGHRFAGLGTQLEHLGALTALTLGVFALRRRTPLTAGALAAAALGLYLCLTLGGAAWLLAPLTTAAVGLALSRRPGRHPAGQPGTAGPRVSGYSVQLLVAVAAPGLVWLLAARYLGMTQGLYAFTLCWAAQLAGLSTFTREFDHPDAPMHPATTAGLAGGLARAGAFVLLPWAALAGGAGPWMLAVQGMFVVALVLLACGLLAARRGLTPARQVSVLGCAGLGGWLNLVPA